MPHPRAPSPICLLLPFVLAATPAQDPPAPSRHRSLEAARAELAAAAQAAAAQAPPAAAAGAAGPLRLVDVSLDLMAAFGASTARDSELLELQGGGHDPRQRGFTMEQAELSLVGAVDPWFRASMYMVALLEPGTGESVVELEEAFLTTQRLPFGLQLQAGTFLCDFGRANARHPHSWDWLDQPVVNTRFFGGDGLRGPGARLAWLLPSERFAELTFGVHNAHGETMASFLANDEVYAERPVGGRFFTEREVRSAADLLYTARAATSFDLSDTQDLGVGASVAAGPNATGPDATTVVYGADFVWRWRPLGADQGYPFVEIEGEIMARDFAASEQIDEGDPTVTGDEVSLPGTTLRDHGGYLQCLWGFATGWAVGVRVDAASGSGASYVAGAQTFARDSDPFRGDRLGISPMLAWKPSEFSRLRVQYDYDDSDHLGEASHSLWIGFEVLIGAHPPHAY